MSPITQQPNPTSMLSDKQPTTDGVDCRYQHRSCHYARLRRIIPTIFLILTTIFLAFLEFSNVESGGLGSGTGLLRRATSTATGSNNSSFVKNKLYLIILFVGLFLVLLAALALSFWCCKGVFQNPLCCPCYLCACCGGLACLECISCGLCAEGINDLNV